MVRQSGVSKNSAWHTNYSQIKTYPKDRVHQEGKRAKLLYSRIKFEFEIITKTTQQYSGSRWIHEEADDLDSLRDFTHNTVHIQVPKPYEDVRESRGVRSDDSAIG